MKPHEFDEICRLTKERFGLDLKKGKEQLVAARLGRKLREGRFHSFHDYYRHILADRTGESLIALIDALTTNHTAFLREPAHFEFLEREIWPRIASRNLIEVWSAACSTGEEPYSIAFLLSELASSMSGSRPRLRILATDISTRVLEKARRAVYAEERVSALPRQWLPRYLLRGRGKWEGYYGIKPEIAALVNFERLNLVEPLSSARKFPLIFCRNVLIYFDRELQRDLVTRLAECLEPGGYLFVGHAESLSGLVHPLAYVRPAIYRRPESAERRR